MKCIRNKQNGNIIRVDDKQANQMVGMTWEYIAKSEWKKLVRDVKTEKQIVEEEKKTETQAKKQEKNRKLKEKQSL
jgi:hypothetical protein